MCGPFALILLTAELEQTILHLRMIINDWRTCSSVPCAILFWAVINPSTYRYTNVVITFNVWKKFSMTKKCFFYKKTVPKLGIFLTGCLLNFLFPNRSLGTVSDRLCIWHCKILSLHCEKWCLYTRVKNRRLAIFFPWVNSAVNLDGKKTSRKII